MLKRNTAAVNIQPKNECSFIIHPKFGYLDLIEHIIPLRFCEFKISNNFKNMVDTKTSHISTKGLAFSSLVPVSLGSLLRVRVELPNYWSLKSKHVDYNHTEAPHYFQMLCRTIFVEELSNPQFCYQVLCENVNMDNIDLQILTEHLK